jgi:pimeloyl-ACP methyl ester carboxylesterase
VDQRTTDLDAVTLTCLLWGDADDTSLPLALLLHGFPDTAHTWRHVAPRLVEAGYRVVAPFTRGYAPSGLAADGSYHVPALMSDALALHAAYDGDDRALLVGHDWGAITASGIAAMEEQPFGSIAVLAVPPIGAMNPDGSDLGAWLRILPRQATMSWYTLFNQLPGLPERRFERLVAHLWRRWSPHYLPDDDLALLARSLPDRAHRSAALGYYRAQTRPWRLPAAYADLQPVWTRPPRVPILYLQGAFDGCLDPRWADHVRDRLPAGSRTVVVPSAGHFLQLEQPQAVAGHLLEHVGARRA